MLLANKTCESRLIILSQMNEAGTKVHNLKSRDLRMTRMFERKDLKGTD